MHDGGVIYDDYRCVYREKFPYLNVLLGSYTAGRDCTCEISGMVGISIYVVDECELLMAVMATVAVPWDIVGC